MMMAYQMWRIKNIAMMSDDHASVQKAFLRKVSTAFESITHPYLTILVGKNAVSWPSRGQ